MNLGERPEGPVGPWTRPVDHDALTLKAQNDVRGRLQVGLPEQAFGLLLVPPDMKFIDGFWLLKPHYALQVVQASDTTDGYDLHVFTKPVRHRRDTLGGPLLSIRVHAPTEGIIGVKIEHFKVS